MKDFTFGGATTGENAKRKREEHAINLRKQKREEYFKEKRAQIGSKASQVPTPIAGSSTIVSHNEKLIDFDLDDALTYINQIPTQDFMRETEKINFKKSDISKLIHIL